MEYGVLARDYGATRCSTWVVLFSSPEKRIGVHESSTKLKYLGYKAMIGHGWSQFVMANAPRLEQGKVSKQSFWKSFM